MPHTKAWSVSVWSMLASDQRKDVQPQEVQIMSEEKMLEQFVEMEAKKAAKVAEE